MQPAEDVLHAAERVVARAEDFARLDDPATM